MFQLADEGTPCSDGDVCSGNDTCVSGLCMGLAGTNCNDGNPCTDDLCDPTSGCTYSYNEQSCEDGDLCSSPDSCVEGECVPGPATICDDDDLCTVDICKSDVGCLYSPLDCNDETLCNGEETCHPIYGCQEGTPPVCTDDDPCKLAQCDADEGCVSLDLCGPGPYTETLSPTAVEGESNARWSLRAGDTQSKPKWKLKGRFSWRIRTSMRTSWSSRLLFPKTKSMRDLWAHLKREPTMSRSSMACGNKNSQVDWRYPILRRPQGERFSFLGPVQNDAFNSNGTPVEIPAEVLIDGFAFDPATHLIQWSVDGSPVGSTSTTTFVFPNVSPGRKHLTAELLHTDGTPVDAEDWKVTIPVKVVTLCGSPGDCYESVCSNLACATECKYGPSYPGCCTSDTMCEPGSVCVDGTCQECAVDLDCVEGDTCTVDRCIEGVCVHDPVPDCCEIDSDCDDENPCTIDICLPGLGTCDVEIDTLEGCCTTSLDCGDQNPCTLDFCIANECRYGPHPEYTSCCSEDADCIEGNVCVEGQCIECSESINPSCDDGNPCTVTACDFVTNKCQIEEVPNCCQSNSDCDDDNSCTSNTCNTTFLTCFFGDPDEGCCDIDEHCDDEVPCNVDRCISGECRHGPDPLFPTCCQPGALGLNYLNCNDQNPCTQDIYAATRTRLSAPIPLPGSGMLLAAVRLR